MDYKIDLETVERRFDIIKRNLLPQTKATESIWRRRRDLMGTSISVATLTAEPFLFEISQKDLEKYPYQKAHSVAMANGMALTGLYADLLGQLMNTLNFTVDIKQAPDGEYGSFDNGSHTWSGLVGMVNRVKKNKMW